MRHETAGPAWRRNQQARFGSGARARCRGGPAGWPRRHPAGSGHARRWRPGGRRRLPGNLGLAHASGEQLGRLEPAGL